VEKTGFDPERKVKSLNDKEFEKLASVSRAAAFGPGYLKGFLSTIFCSEVSKNFS
jgi:ribosomal protein S13